jgi:hypothetical protein
LPKTGELIGPDAVSEETEMTDADEAMRDDVQEEATDELVSVKGALFELVVVASVSVEESDLAVVDIEDAMVGDGDAVGVASQVVEDLVRATEGRLGVDDPVDGIEATHELMESGLGSESGKPTRQSELTVGAEFLEAIKELAPEDLGEGLNVEEEVLRSRDPASEIFGENAAWDDTVKVDVISEQLIPGMQDRREAHDAAEPVAGI